MSKRKKKEAWAENGLEDWGSYMAAKKAKLEEQFQVRAANEFETPSTLFNGVYIFVNGYTNPSADELKRLMMKYGGVYHHYMRPRITTHIIATNLPYSKIMMHKKSQNPLPICKPEWISESIKAGRLLDYQNYLLYSNHTKTQPKLQFKATGVEGTSEADKGTILEATTHEDTAATGTALRDESKMKSTEFSENCARGKDSAAGTGKHTAGSMSTKNPEFLSEFYNNSRLHHISTMGAMFKDYINELRDKSDGKFPGLDRLKRCRPPNRFRSAMKDIDEEEEDAIDFTDNSKKINKETVIMHIDMDCFFVSVGLRNRPDLRGLPVAVTHSKGNQTKNPQNAASRETELRMYKQRFREKLDKTHAGEGTSSTAEFSTRVDNLDDNCSMSEIASCSYEARKAGVKNGMFMGQALKLCPDLRTIQYDFEGYKEVSYALYDTVASYTLNIEAVSCDEMYTDLTTVLAESNLTPLEFAEVIRGEIKEKTGCPVSTGFGRNKLQARLATRKAKPDGQFHLKSENVQTYLGSFNVRDLPGVGHTMAYKLKAMDVRTCTDLQNILMVELQKEFGKKTGEMLYNLCRGIDNSKLNLEHVRKSVSAEVNYGIRFEDSNEAEDFLKRLTEEVCNRLKKANMRGRCVTLKLMIRAKDAPRETAKFMGHGVCDHITRSKNLISPVNDLSIIVREVFALWNQLQQTPADIRGVGIQISRLESTKSKSGSGDLKSFMFTTKSKNDAATSSTEMKENNASTSKTVIKNCEKPSKPSEPKGLKAFLVPKQSASATKTAPPKPSSVAKNVPIPEQKPSTSRTTTGDEFVLSELPDEIRNEICGLRKDVSNDNTTESIQTNHTVPSEQNKKTDSHRNTRKAEISGNITTTNCSQKTSIASSSTSQGAKNQPLMQDIDESILAELPEHIRNEIIADRKRQQESFGGSQRQKSSKIQTKQESYFKEVKPIERPNKVQMPAVQDLDLAVLIELPEDIRNEILNEYREGRDNPSDDSRNVPSCSNAVTDRIQDKTFIDECNLSFSQVDPDFLSALPEDVRSDVKRYCITKKLEKESRTKPAIKLEIPFSKRLGSTTNDLPSKQKTTRQPKSKTGKNVKNGKNNKNGTTKRSKTSLQDEVYSSDKTKTNTSCKSVQNEQKIDHTGNETNEVDSRGANNTAIVPKIDDHQAMLNRLVEQFLSLPLKHMKMQMQSWILASDSVNEVDFLSLATFLSTLPEKKRIEDLHVLLKTMHRCISKTGNCVWHRMYRKTVEHVQRHMQAEYESNLMLPPVECEHHNCGSILTQ